MALNRIGDKWTVMIVVEYSLTPLGRTLIEVLEQIRGWAEGNIEVVPAVQQAFDSVNPDAGNRMTAGKIVRFQRPKKTGRFGPFRCHCRAITVSRPCLFDQRVSGVIVDGLEILVPA